MTVSSRLVPPPLLPDDCVVDRVRAARHAVCARNKLLQAAGVSERSRSQRKKVSSTAEAQRKAEKEKAVAHSHTALYEHMIASGFARWATTSKAFM